ncbi:MAG: hypothetical protein ABIK62_04600, partial [candidate division WOR-3 bacterium]
VDNLPSRRRPNNVVAALMADLDLKSDSNNPNPGKVFIWNNANMDTFIVEYDSVKFWSTGGNNTFQIILSRPDSSITVMYKQQSGAPYNGWVPGNATVGIENIAGSVGLSYLYGNIPSRNMIHDSLAIRYYPPETSAYQCHDLCTWRAMNDENGAIFLLRDQPVTLWAKVKNTGNQAESNVPVYCIVRNSTNNIVFADTLTTGDMAPGQIDSLVFTPEWTPSPNGVYTVRVITNLTGDVFRGNDTVIIETRVVTLPAELGYDAGQATNSMYWNGNSGGFGNYFEAPTYPIEITAIKAMLNYNTAPVTCTLWLFKADGPGGGPGTVLARGNVTVNSSSPTWYQVNISPPVQLDAGGFFVGVTSDGNQEPSYGMDSLKPLSYRGWEYTGSWAPGRDMDAQDVCMHANVRASGSAVEELIPVKSGLVLGAQPNPFEHSTTIWFSRKLELPARLGIYDAAGNLVRSIVAQGGSALWDGRSTRGDRVARGVYFARLDDANSVLKVVLTQ